MMPAIYASYVSDAAIKKVENLLTEGEKLLLVLHPDPKRLAWSVMSLWALACGFGFMGVAYLMASAFWTNSPLFAISLGLVWLIIGIILISMPYLAYRGAKRVIYAVTDHRIVVITPFNKPQSYAKRAINQLTIWQKPTSSTGDLYFAGALQGVFGRTGFLGIPEPDEVRRLIMQTFNFDESEFWSA